MVIKYQGETLEYQIEVKNADGTKADLSTCEVAAGLMNGGNVTRITPTIAENIITIKLLPEDTELMYGRHIVEVKIKDSASDIEVIRRDAIQILRSIIPTFEG